MMTNDERSTPRWMTEPDVMPTLEQAMEYAERGLAEAKASGWSANSWCP